MTTHPPDLRVRRQPRWTIADLPAGDVVSALEAALHLPPLVCGLLVSRGYGDAELARRFLRPRFEHLHSPWLMRDMDVAVDRLARACEHGETVLVHGDYDVDGMCSTALATRCLRHFGARVVPFLPHRVSDGYDLTSAGVNAAVSAGASVVLTCDCGTSAAGPVADLVSRGIDVIVSDHHLPGGPLPACLAVLNPRRPDCAYPDKDLAAVGVVFKLMLALAERMGDGATSRLVYDQLDLVALATVADVAPLRGENRVLVRSGLRVMEQSPNIGVRSLIRAAGLDGKAPTAGRIGFVLAPRLNAVGRLGHALRGVELLLAESEGVANGIARELEELNRERQELDRATLAHARAEVARVDLDETFGLVIAGEGWHPGVIGIVASRLVEETHRPVMLIAVDNGVGKGSGRSIPAFDLHAGLDACRDLFVRFGGHRVAAGITIEAGRIEAFRERFAAIARERLTPDDLVPNVRVDLELDIGEVGDGLETLLRHFEPFGVGNPAPSLASRAVRLGAAPRVVGKDGLKLQLETPAGSLEAVGWGMSDRAREFAAGSLVDVVFRLERDTWRGASRLQARLVDVRSR